MPLILLTEFSDLQQTPASSAKVMLKVFAQPPGAKAADTHVFSFTSTSTARAEADAIRDALSKAIQALKSGGVSAEPGGGASSASMAIASAMSSMPNDVNAIYDDEKLIQDAELQRSLLKANQSLQRTFTESVRTRPDTLSLQQFSNQFWSTRIHLLRAHAIEKTQTRGSYNVLSTIKPIVVDNTTKLSISKEQIQLIFSQHPLVKRVYDENVPKISEESYWSRFFQSRLFKKMKGERLAESDPADAILDEYLNVDEDEERAKRLMSAHVPHIIDIEGNEENHSQRKGNDGDITMRAKQLNKAPIIRTLNSLSEKILSHVTPNDVDPSLPIGVDEETFNELRLRDLQGEEEERRNILNIKDQSRFFASDKESEGSEDTVRYAKQDPKEVLKNMRAEVAKALSYTDLSGAIGVDEDSDSEDDGDGRKDHVGSRSARTAATSQMLAAITQQQLQTEDTGSEFTTVATSSRSGLSEKVFDRLTLTHATTTEFLSHFWSAFLSGSVSRAEEIGKMVETLDRAMDRIRAVADDAEGERLKEVQKIQKKVKEYHERTGKRRRFNPDDAEGGKKAVNALMAPTIKAIETAGREYRRVLEEQAEEGP